MLARVLGSNKSVTECSNTSRVARYYLLYPLGAQGLWLQPQACHLLHYQLGYLQKRPYFQDHTLG